MPDPAPQNILLLDDDPDVLEVYRELLTRLPSQPRIHTASSGARAIALLESDTFHVLISDLNMPKMDGLQVLAIVRRKFPHLRTAVLTGLVDEQMRARAYAIGVDLYLEKPSSPRDIRLFTECVESLLDQETRGGFRGVQSKSLVDLIQLECLSNSSALLKITNGPAEGKIWIKDGEVIDAATEQLTGEAAFLKILDWRTGNFEILTKSPEPPRAIFKSCQALLLESAQALDEAASEPSPGADPSASLDALGTTPNPLVEIGQLGGVEFVLSSSRTDPTSFDAWGVENPEAAAAWARQTLQEFEELGAQLQAGPLRDLVGLGLQGHVGMVPTPERHWCVGFRRTLAAERVIKEFEHIQSEWLH
jgi:CheY-like chemotaxis protein